MRKIQQNFVRERFASKLGDTFKRLAPDEFPFIEQTMFDAGLMFNSLIVKYLTQSNAIATGKLASPSTPQVYQTTTGYVIEVGYPIDSPQADYYDYINQGVQGLGGKNARYNSTSGKYKFKYSNPSKKMVRAIYQWLAQSKKSIRTERIIISKSDRKKKKLSAMLDEASSKKSLAYVVARKIKRDGIRATYYFDKAIKNTFNQEFISKLATAIEGDIVLQINQYGGNNS